MICACLCGFYGAKCPIAPLNWIYVARPYPVATRHLIFQKQLNKRECILMGKGPHGLSQHNLSNDDAVYVDMHRYDTK